MSDQSLRSELNRRIGEFAGYSDTTFGALDRRDLLATVVLFIGVPLLVVWGLR